MTILVISRAVKTCLGSQVTETTTCTTPEVLLNAPGYVVRRLQQAYIGAWLRTVDATLTGPQFAVLTAVETYPGTDQGTLATSVDLDRSTMADIVRRLEERGLITRRPDVHDGRRKLLHLTDEGVSAVHDVNARARQLDERLLETYPAADRKRLLNELTALADHWESIHAGR
jgi:DNA-binding MarR family transcriptional regulator